MAPTTEDNPIPAASTGRDITYTYRAYNDVNEDGEANVDDTAIDMAGGAVQITIPPGWKVHKDRIEITDGTDDKLYLKDAVITGTAEPADNVTATPLRDVDKDFRLVEFTRTDGDNVERIVITLSAAWAATLASGVARDDD